MSHSLLILGSGLVLLLPHQAGVKVYALHGVYHTQKRLVCALILDYRSVYRVDVSARAGDLLRIAGSFEVSENDREHNRIYGYLAVRPADTQTRTRVSSFAWQVATREQNHHMPLNLFGSYKVSSNGDYSVELMARRTEDSQVLVEDIENEESDHGQIIVELYRPYSSVQSALQAGAHLLVDTERAPFNFTDVRVPCVYPSHLCAHRPEPGKTYYSLPGTKRFSLAAGDILRLQGAATAQLLSSASLFGVYLRAVFGRDDYESLSVAPENLTEVLSRFTLQNDGVYTATNARGVYAGQYVGYWFGTHLIRQGANTDLVAMQFTNAPNRRPVAFLSDTQTLTTTSDYVFGVGLPPRELFSVSGQHKAGDVLRAQSQVQLEMVEGRTRADCWARIEIYENGTLAYRSIFDERHIRNSSESSKDHDVGAFSPFALYRTRRAGDHTIKLITDCNADKRAAMRAKYYGRHLTVDQFTFTEP